MNRTRTSKNAKRLLVWLLLLTMVFGLLPMAAFADDAGESVVSEEPVQESAQPSTEPTEAPSEPSEEPTQEPEPEQPGNAVVTIEGDEEQPEDEMLAADEIAFDYAGKTRSVRLSNGEFQRIFLLDCGRKYFTPDEVKAIIDELQKNHYTHIELAFGNDGLRFLLNDMSLTANGKNYTTDEVTAAIEYGNQQFCSETSASSAAWSQTDMDDIISYAGKHGIKVVPLLNAPGHMFAVVKAMEKLELTDAYVKVGYAGSSPNWGLNVTNPAAVNFVKELVQKYVAYFAGKGCTMFNIGADESGITADNYSAYAQLVNSHAAMVQNSGMVAMAFNDGIYNPSYTGNLNGVEFDNNIVISYWSYEGGGAAKAESLDAKGFVINSTHNNWYYVLGKNNNNWAGYNTAKNNMKTVKCTAVDSGYTTNSGCTLAVWCDNPYVDYNTNSSNVKTLISTFASENSGYFVAPQKPVLTASKSDIAVGDTVTLTLSNYEGNVNWSCDKPDVLSLEQGNSNSVTATALSVGTAAVTATMADGEAATISITVAETVFDKTENITLVVGVSSEPFVQDELYPTVEDMELVNDDGTVVASYTLTHTPGTEYKFTAVTSVREGNTYYISPADGYYFTADGSTTDDLSEAAAWTLRSSDYGSFFGYYLQNGTRYLYYNGSSWTTGTNSSRTPIYFNNGTFYRTREWNYTYSNPLGAPGKRTGDKTDPKTNIVFKGLAVGTTSVIIGNVKYNITVVAEDLDKVSPLPIQLWITDNTIEASGDYADVTSGTGWGGDKGTARYIKVPAAAKNDSSSINSAQGMTVVDAFAAIGMGNPIVRYEYGGTRYIAEQEDKPALEHAFWTGRIHDSSSENIQTVYGTDFSNSGEEFTFVRYWGGVWEVSADRQNWTKVTGKGSTGSKSGCTEQLVAYYMMRTKITDEVTTQVADWGYSAGSTECNNFIDKNDYVILDFAVKYEDGTSNPNIFPQNGKTLIFNVNNSGIGEGGIKYRKLNNFRAENNSDFEVYMVTVKMTSDSANTQISQPKTSYTYDGKEQVVWARDEATLNNSGLDAYTSISGSNVYSGCKFGGDPYVRGVEVYNKHGALITYYVRAIIKEDSLEVHYINSSADNHEFYNYGITVNEGTFFAENFGQAGANSTVLQGNTVINSLGVEQAVTAELKDIPAIGAQYRYSDYTCVGASRSDDGKDVYLYYTFNAAKTFVVDFGLPLKIEPKDVNEQLGEAYNSNRLTRVITGDSKYAAVTVEDKVITYTLNQTIDGRDDIVATYYGTQVTSEGVKENNVSYTLSFIPASNVYYEDSFAQVNNGKGAAKNATWVRTGNNSDARQALTELGKAGDSVYGYDSAYANNTQYSMNGYSMVTVESAMASDTWDANNDAWPTATFTFKGTGFDVISLTNNQSGAILVSVYSGKTAEGTAIKKYIVDNYFGYEYTEGGWKVTNNAGTLYQIPVMKITGLDYGEYTAVITVFYDGLFDNDRNNSYSFWLDAIRVYDPMGENVSDYTKDKEGYPQYIKLRTEIINKNETNKNNAMALFIDGAAAATVEQYKNFGPNNEVYLANGQAISFKLPVNEDIATVQIGAKSPDGKAKMNVKINGAARETEIGSATEMYYKISETGAVEQQVTITNTGSDILSLTNIKVTYGKDNSITLMALTDSDAEAAVATVRALFAEPEQPEEPEKTFEPKRFDCEWSKNVRKGGRAILTVKASTDVESILINGEAYDKYVTRTERIGWGRNAQRVTYREFVYMITADEAGTFNYDVAAVNVEGVQSAARNVTLTVKASSPIRDWIGGLFGRWF